MELKNTGHTNSAEGHSTCTSNFIKFLSTMSATSLPSEKAVQASLEKCVYIYTRAFWLDWFWFLSLFQVFTRKLEEVGRVLFLISLTQKIPTAHKQSHVSMLQEDLLRLPSFPRNAIDAEFSLFSDPQGMAFWWLSLVVAYSSEGLCEALHLPQKHRLETHKSPPRENDT